MNIEMKYECGDLVFDVTADVILGNPPIRRGKPDDWQEGEERGIDDLVIKYNGKDISLDMVQDLLKGELKNALYSHAEKLAEESRCEYEYERMMEAIGY